MPPIVWTILLLATAVVHGCSARSMRTVVRLVQPWAASKGVGEGLQGGLPHPSFAGYFPLRDNASMYYAYYEAFDPAPRLLETGKVPVVLWLQVQPPACPLRAAARPLHRDFAFQITPLP